jgi:YhcH/YjgK/YiaL family protein
MADAKWTREKATKWFSARELTIGSNLQAHESVDVLEFASQYAKNRILWEKAFAYLRDTDLGKVAPGKYFLDDDHVYVSVAHDKTKPFEDTRWEAHQKYVDIQYVIRGKEKMGLAPISSALIRTPYNPDEDIAFYEVAESDSNYYLAEPGVFFIFFPSDVHRPCIHLEGCEENKKLVIKIRTDRSLFGV